MYAQPALPRLVYRPCTSNMSAHVWQGENRSCLQALSLGHAVRMQGSLPGCTPAIITPPFISPAAAGDPGATPMNDATPEVSSYASSICQMTVSVQYQAVMYSLAAAQSDGCADYVVQGSIIHQILGFQQEACISNQTPSHQESGHAVDAIADQSY